MKVLKKLSYKTRREIYQLYNNSAGRVFSPKDLAKVYDVSLPTIYNILNRRVKFRPGDRRDKGIPRGAKKTLFMRTPERQELQDAATQGREMLEFQVHAVLSDLETKQINIIEKTKILADISRIQRHLKEQEIESHIKRADAQVIARIIRRFMPAATDADIIKIFREELDRWKAES